MLNNRIDLEKYEDVNSSFDKILRLLWTIVWFLLIKPFPKRTSAKFTRIIINLFGGQLHRTAVVYSSVRIYRPWLLIMKEYSTLGYGVDCYNPATVEVGAHSVISQNTRLCSATHNIRSANMKLELKPIKIGDGVWVAADCFIGPGVLLDDLCVVGARSAVFKNVESNTVVGGNPARNIGLRFFNDE